MRSVFAFIVAASLVQSAGFVHLLESVFQLGLGLCLQYRLPGLRLCLSWRVLLRDREVLVITGTGDYKPFNLVQDI